ncbi:Transcription regulator [Patulibacter medicamentivorans]|uniref:Transcription regulator n=1 Tax=Patulibacter medicamentivorans TaxID=1097667 RepID=H0EBH8_9ACTN|nr:diacylglycerol kinase family protein [Patulibacter medicamentivorans]EHN08959.1 Transcription regulator [Patulibacter medicamentivorans]
MSARRLHVLCNPTAGGGRGARALAAVEAALRGRRIEVRVERSDSHDHAVELARTAAATGAEVVAFGGDGMVRLVAHEVRSSDATLGILPGGRGNDFAARLGIPRDPVAACALLADGATRTIDVGDADGQTFVGVASIGLESEVTRLANAAPRIGGRAVYAGAMVVGLARWRPARFELVVDGAPHRFTGFLAAAANSGRFGGGMRIAPDARLDDGLLDLIVIEHGSRARFLRNAPKVFAGSHVHERDVQVLRASEIRMEADRPFDVYADGDPIARTPAIVRAVPAAIRVISPP